MEVQYSASSLAAFFLISRLLGRDAILAVFVLFTVVVLPLCIRGWLVQLRLPLYAAVCVKVGNLLRVMPLTGTRLLLAASSIVLVRPPQLTFSFSTKLNDLTSGCVSINSLFYTHSTDAEKTTAVTLFCFFVVGLSVIWRVIEALDSHRVGCLFIILIRLWCSKDSWAEGGVLLFGF